MNNPEFPSEDDYPIIVMTESPHGKTWLHTFWNVQKAGLPGERDDAWFIANPPSVRQRVDPAMRFLTQQRGPGSMKYMQMLDENRIDLGAGVTPCGNTLAVILDALRNAGIQGVARDDINTVLSHLGGRIVKLRELSSDQRRHAESALYSEIVRRCTKL